jgi:hypothetical protein
VLGNGAVEQMGRRSSRTGVPQDRARNEHRRNRFSPGREDVLAGWNRPPKATRLIEAAARSDAIAVEIVVAVGRSRRGHHCRLVDERRPLWRRPTPFEEGALSRCVSGAARARTIDGC